MEINQVLLIAACFLLIAFLYSSVGHAGASGYIAVMSLFGLAPDEIKPTALILNILVASIASWQFWRAGHLDFYLFLRFAVLSVPFALLGGYLNFPAQVFKIVVGIILLFSAAQFFMHPREIEEVNPPPASLAIGSGGILGFLAGLSATGGGIFLTPLLVYMKWADIKRAAAISALFILVNSIAGLAGNLYSARILPALIIWLVAAVLIGGALGSYLGSRNFSPVIIKRLLSVVLVIAGLKLIFASP